MPMAVSSWANRKHYTTAEAAAPHTSRSSRSVKSPLCSQKKRAARWADLVLLAIVETVQHTVLAGALSCTHREKSDHCK
jgi:hypothetical protein